MYIHYICQWDWGKRRKRIGRRGPTTERMRTLAGRERMPSVSIWWRRDRSAGGKLPEREWVIILKRESISCRKSIVAIYPSARAFISKAPVAHISGWEVTATLRHPRGRDPVFFFSGNRNDASFFFFFNVFFFSFLFREGGRWWVSAQISRAGVQAWYGFSPRKNFQRELK